MQPSIPDLAKVVCVKLQCEADEFVKFYTQELGELQGLAVSGKHDALYEKKKVLCANLQEARHRFLSHWQDLDTALGVAVQSYQTDILTLVRKDNQRLMRTMGVLKTAPVVAVLGYHGEEADTLRDQILKVGGAYTKLIGKNTVTHVIAKPESLTRHAKLCEWDIPIVTKDWLAASVQEMQFVDHVTYLIHKDDIPVAPPVVVAPRTEGQPLQEEGSCSNHAGSEAFRRAVECITDEMEAPPAMVGENSFALNPMNDSQQGGRPTSRKRLTRKELLGDASDGDAPPQKKPRNGVAPGTANSNANKVCDPAADSQAERLPELVVKQEAHPLAAPLTGGVESQMIRWDTNGTHATTQKMKQRAATRIFQMAGGGSVPKGVREALSKKIKYLGGEVELVPKYVEEATHLLMLADIPQLTEKYLSFVAAGKWILGHQYVTDSHAAGHWLDEADFSNEGTEGTIAFHRGSMGGAFSKWKVVLLMEPGGVQVILRAGGCKEISNALTPENIGTVTHILTDAPCKEVVLVAPKGDTPQSTLDEVKTRVFNVEVLYRILCVSPDESVAVESCGVNATWS